MAWGVLFARACCTMEFHSKSNLPLNRVMAKREDMQLIAAGCSNAGGTGAGPPEAIPAAKSKAKATPKAAGKRKARPRIDLDDAIAAAQQSFRQTAKCMAKARADARNEKRKKARLFKKAAQLSPMDLERIAVLKRSGMWDPNLQGICDAQDLRAMEEQPSNTSACSGNRPPHPADNASEQPPDAMAQTDVGRSIHLTDRNREAGGK